MILVLISGSSSFLFSIPTRAFNLLSNKLVTFVSNTVQVNSITLSHYDSTGLGLCTAISLTYPIFVFAFFHLFQNFLQSRTNCERYCQFKSTQNSRQKWQPKLKCCLALINDMSSVPRDDATCHVCTSCCSGRRPC
jgi:hypothetical protein